MGTVSIACALMSVAFAVAGMLGIAAGTQRYGQMCLALSIPFLFFTVITGVLAL